LTSFIGRAREIAEVKRLLDAARLVTLTGSGGAGKTRLALQVAADVVEDYPDGVWLAEFAPIADPVLVPKTAASALSVPEQRGREMIETLVDALRPKSLLLVLDNCEHLLAACADLAAVVLRACPQVRILATSREGLGVPGETLWRVPSLSLPDARRLPTPEDLVLYEAVRLFVDRATATAPEFGVTSENAPAVAQVCRRLDGIPLAIELPAARVKVLAVEQIVARLDDRFRLLTGGSRMVLPRQQALRAAIDWSYNLLSETERVLFRRLSVFAGGWTLEAAEAICEGGNVEAANILDVLTSLVDKSLVLAETQAGESRYRLLETVRQYARDRLVEAGEEAVVRTQHRAWCVTLAKRIEAGLFGSHHRASINRFEAEHDNLRMALAWSMEDPAGAEAGLRLAGSLYWLWYSYGYWAEGRRWVEGALARRHAAPRGVLPKAFSGATYFAWRQGDLDRARLLGEEGLAIAREQEDTETSALMLCWLGVVASREPNYLRAAELFNEGLRLSREVGNARVTCLLLNQIGVIERWQGNLERAAALHEESLSLKPHPESGIRPYTLRCLGLVALQGGHYERAKEFFSESLLIARKMRIQWIIFECLIGLAGVSTAHADYDRAARLYGVAEALRVTIGHRPSPPDQADYDRRLASTRIGLAEGSFAAAWAEGCAMTLERAIEYALADWPG
jgi:non-specific serine/threonine protein kinase